VIVRHHGVGFPLLDDKGKDFDLLSELRTLGAHQPGTWPVKFEHEAKVWPVWLQAVRKSAVAAEQAKARLRKEHGQAVQAQTLELAEYVVVLTSLDPAELPAAQILGLYRGRWQIELVFKRLKSLLGVGELAKYDPDSAKAWLQAKLLTALLLERLEREASFFSPWGYPLLPAFPLAGVPRSAGQFRAGGGPGAAARTTHGAGREDRAQTARASSATEKPGEHIN
jgi:hypothetical protein